MLCNNAIKNQVEVEQDSEHWISVLKKAYDDYVNNKGKDDDDKQEGINEINRSGTNKTGLYLIFLRRLKEIGRASKKQIIPFPLLFEKLCRNFSISKKECWDILFLLRDVGIIEIMPYHGVKIF